MSWSCLETFLQEAAVEQPVIRDEGNKDKVTDSQGDVNNHGTVLIVALDVDM